MNKHTFDMSEYVPDLMLRDLHDDRRWLPWRNRDGKKVPDGSTTDPNTWRTRKQLRGGDGVGIVLGELDDTVCLCGIDLDGCLDGDMIDDTARRIIDRFDTYSEVSVSGRGLHQLFMVRRKDLRALGLTTRRVIRNYGEHREIAL